MSIPNAGPGAQFRAPGAFLSLAQRGDLPIAEPGTPRQGLLGWHQELTGNFLRLNGSNSRDQVTGSGASRMRHDAVPGKSGGYPARVASTVRLQPQRVLTENGQIVYIVDHQASQLSERGVDPASWQQVESLAAGLPIIQDDGDFGVAGVVDGNPAFLRHRIAHPMMRTTTKPNTTRTPCKAKRREVT